MDVIFRFGLLARIPFSSFLHALAAHLVYVLFLPTQIVFLVSFSLFFGVGRKGGGLDEVLLSSFKLCLSRAIFA